jgi:hypothetical protein
MPVKPNTAAIRATTKNVTAQLSMMNPPVSFASDNVSSKWVRTNQFETVSRDLKSRSDGFVDVKANSCFLTYRKTKLHSIGDRVKAIIADKWLVLALP